jgi:hypothetical protein
MHMSPRFEARRGAFALPLLALLIVTAVSPARAATYTWANTAGGNWSNAANWSPTGVPGTGDVAVLPSLGGSYSVSLDTQPALAELDLATGATLDLGAHTLASVDQVTNAGAVTSWRGVLDGSRFHNQTGGLVAVATNDSMVVAGTLVNDGTIRIGPGAGSSLFLTDTLKVSGAGTIQFLPGARLNCPLARPQTAIWVMNGAGHTIRGGGDLWVPIQNRGTLRLDGGDGALMTLHEALYNYGTVHVGNGARINVDFPLVKSFGGRISGTNGSFTVMMPNQNMGPIDNLNGGSFVAESGDLTLTALTIAGGSFERADSGAVVIGYAANIQNPVIQPGAELRVDGLLDLSVNGSVVENHGTLRVRGTCQIDGDSSNVVSFAGDGQCVLEGGTLTSPIGGGLVNLPGHTITGCGTMSANLTNLGNFNIDCSTGGTESISSRIVNNGSIKVLHGNLYYYGNRFSNHGTLDGANGGIVFMKGLRIDNAGTMSSGRGGFAVGLEPTAIVGGTLAGTGGIRNVGQTTLQGVTLAQNATYSTVSGATTTATGSAFTNQGSNVVESGGVFTTSATTDYLQNSGATVLHGGTLTVPRGFQVNGSLSGTGVVVGNVTNAGQLTPDVSNTGITIQGDYHQLSSGQLAIGIAGSGAGQHGQLQVTGAATLDGAVAVSKTSGYVAGYAQSFQVMQFGSRSGQFGEVQSDLEVGVAPVYTDATVTLETAAPLGVSDPAAPKTVRFAATRGGFVLELPTAADVTVRAYDVAGREIAMLANGPMAAGVHPMLLGSAGSAAASGLYFARATLATAGGREVHTARVVLLR